MRGIVVTLSRLQGARAMLAGAALLAGAASQKAMAQSEDTAMAVPRLEPHGTDGVALPQPLEAAEAARLRRIFADQAHGRMLAAAQGTASLDSTTALGRAMLGHVLADRYLGRFYRPDADELTRWLLAYPDNPSAAAIHDLLRQRLPRGRTAPPPPDAPALADLRLPDPVPEDSDPSGSRIARNPLLDETVHERAATGHADSALRLIGKTRGMTAAYGAQLRAEIAQILFARNEDAEALNIAADAVHRDPSIGLAGYIAGLAAWRLNRPDLAVGYFEAAGHAANAPSALHAAAGFWAARAHQRIGDGNGSVAWVKWAASQPRTFYGMLARRMLGIGIGSGLTWNKETLGEADIEAVAATQEGRNAFALLQLGELVRADAELRRLAARKHDDVPLTRAVMLVAETAKLFDLSADLAALVQSEDGRPRDYVRFPVPSLRPRDGFEIDPPLLYALTRIESNFDTAAVSPVGALGLMQIMPVTATYVAADVTRGLAVKDALHDPAYNLEIGQRYVRYLAGHDAVRGNLIRLLAAYNAGPGNLTKWLADMHDGGDPLMFIEAIPNDETRAFVQHGLAYSWIYAARLRMPAPSLDELAIGSFPRVHEVTAWQRDAKTPSIPGRLH